MKGISRIDSKHTRGWFLRIYRRGRVHSKMFSDGVHGGREKALRIALAYKEEYERRHPPSLISTRLRLRPQKNNTSGIVGVSETYARSKKGEKLPCFCVNWSPRRNTSRAKKFFYHYRDIGSREAAFEAAVAFRREREAEIIRGLEPL